MARLLFIFYVLAMANEKAVLPEAKAVHIGRKFGETSRVLEMSPSKLHKHEEIESNHARAMSPSEPHKHEEMESIHRPAMSPVDPHRHDEYGQFEREVSSSGEKNPGIPREREIKVKHHHHRSIDKSVAGGGVILCGLVTTFMVALFCYIRATRRKHVEPCSPSATSSASLI